MDIQIDNVRIKKVKLDIKHGMDTDKIDRQFNSENLRIPKYMEMLEKLSTNQALREILRGHEFPVGGGIENLRGTYRIDDISLKIGLPPQTGVASEMKFMPENAVVVTGGEGQVMLKVHNRIASSIFDAGFTLRTLHEDGVRIRTLVGIIRK